jgi:hypothetical protein
MSASTVYLSHSRKSVMQACGRKYYLQYVERLASKVQSSNLGFGSSVHSGIASYLTAKHFGVDTDPGSVFESEWSDYTSNNVIQYASTWTPEDLAATGRVMLQKFMEDWTKRGWTPVVDVDGNPIIERELRINLPGNIVFTVIIDAVVRTPDGKVYVLDFKTPAQPSMPGFAALSDQLIGYQEAVKAHAAQLGISTVDGLVFYELIKRKVPKSSRGEGPTIHVEEPALPRSQTDVADWILECQFVANDIRSRRFSKRPMDAYNTPCALCDYSKKCLGIPDDNLEVRPKRVFAAA